jgi:DNA primase
VTGQTVGFGARRLLDDDKGPKYLNTPETAIYHKAQVLYGLDLAKRDISRSQRVVVVEGYTDVMACHLAGVTTAIATCGTAFGVDHIKVLRRVLGDDSGVGEVVFTFDGDEAGQKAAMRAFAEEQRFAAQTFVAVAPDGLDPCDLRLARGDHAVRSLVEAKVPMFEFVLRQTVSRFDLDTVEGRVGALRQAAPIVAEIRDPALRPGYSRELARMLGLDLGEVDRAVRAAGRRGRPTSGERRHDERTAAEASTPQAQAPDASQRPFSIGELPNDPSTRLEREALQAMLQYPGQVDATLLQHAVEARFGNPTLAVVRDGVAAAAATGGITVDRVVAQVPAPFAGVVQQLAVLPVPQRNEAAIAGWVRGVLASLVDRELLRQKVELTGRLTRLAGDDRASYEMLQRAIVEIDRERVALRAE